MRLAALVIGLFAAAVCARLGMWQLDRLEQRRELNAMVESRMAELPVEVGAQSPTDALHYRLTTVHGAFDFKRQVLVVARSYQGVPGVHIVTPLVMAGGSAALVERGWAPSPDGRTVDLAGYVEPDSGQVEGVLRVSAGDDNLGAEPGWPLYVRSADPAQLTSRFPYPLFPLVIRRTSRSTNAELRPIPLPQLTNGPHLSYAVQWFTFGTIAVVGGVILFLRKPPGVNHMS